MIQNKNIKLILNYFCGPLVFCILLLSIFSQLHHQASWQSSLQQLHSAISTRSVMLVCMVILLMFANWAIEALKWKLSMGVITPISFSRSMRAIFAGNAFAFFTPNRTGEYFGRMLYLRRDQMVRSVPLTIVGSIAQLMVTLVLGCVGLLVIKTRLMMSTPITMWLSLLLGGSLVVAVLLTIFYFRLPYVVQWLERMRWMPKWVRHVKVLEDVNATVRLSILSLSILRYIVFIAQYYLLFIVFGVDIHWWQAFWAVSVVFLVIAVIPSMGFLSELGIRWQTGLQLIQLFSANITGIFAASLSIWLINLVIPAVAGGVMVLASKLFRK